MSIDFIYNSEYNKVMSGGYMTGSGIFKENINIENIVNDNPNLAVPIGLINYRGGAEKVEPFETYLDEAKGGGIDSGMIGGSVLDSLLNQMNPTYKENKKKEKKEKKEKTAGNKQKSNIRKTKKNLHNNSNKRNTRKH
jgi:hypothetical protein